jgi:hypothetical protein
MTQKECRMPNELDVTSLKTCHVAAGGYYVGLNFREPRQWR